MKQAILTHGLAALLGAGIVYYFWPRIQQNTEIQTVVQHDVRTVIHTVHLPNGTTTTDTTTVDHSKDTVVAPIPTHWYAAVGVSSKVDHYIPVYSLTIAHRILGPFSLGASADTEGRLGLTVGATF